MNRGQSIHTGAFLSMYSLLLSNQFCGHGKSHLC